MNWIFRASPKHYERIWDDYENRDEITQWDFKLHDAKMQCGDRAAIWISGPQAGVYALGRIGSERNYGAPIQAGEGWTPEHDGEFRNWILLDDMRWLDQPILRSALKADPRFASARIIRMPGAANPFLTSDEEWRAITSRRRPNRAR